MTEQRLYVELDLDSMPGVPCKGAKFSLPVDLNFYTAGVGIGCHAGSISNVSCGVANTTGLNVNYVSHKNATDRDKVYAWLKSKIGRLKGGNALWYADQNDPDSYGLEGYFSLTQDDIKVLSKKEKENFNFWKKLIIENTPLIRKIAVKWLTEYVTRNNGYSVYVLSCPINEGSKNKYLDGPDQLWLVSLTTMLFINTLITEKIGVVVGSPTMYNPNHQQKGDRSLNQVFVWIPPEHLKSSYVNTAFISNTSALKNRNVPKTNIGEATWPFKLKEARAL